MGNRQLPEQIAQQTTASVICRRHDWQKTTIPGLLLCSKCHARGKERREQIAQHVPPASPHRAGPHPGLHPEDMPYTTADRPERNTAAYDVGRDVEPRTHNPHVATTQADYDETEEEGEGYTSPGYTRRSIIVRQHPPPRIDPLPHTDSLPPEPRRGLHPVFYIVASLLIIVLFLAGYLIIPPMWQQHTEDATYGRPRTFQTDANVGHGGISHFIVLNNNGTIEVIEIPPDPSTTQPHLYTIVRFQPSPEADLIPATVTFADLAGHGRLDMEVKVYETPDNPTLWILFNNGTTFVPHL